MLSDCQQFSGEERFGKYVDLNEFYARFVNIPAFKWAMRGEDAVSRRSRRSQNKAGDADSSKARKNGAGVDYLTFLARFSEFSDIPQAEKLRSSAYQVYLRDLKTYLLDFYRRTQPLVDLDDVVAETEAKFEKQWALNEVKGWDRGASGSNGEDSEDAKADPLFCALCDKQFNSQGVYNGHLNGKKHKKAAAAAASDAGSSNDTSTSAATPATNPSSSTQMKEIAFDEVLIRRLYELLTEVVHATIAYLELKQTRTHEELQAEIAEEEEGAFSDVELEEHGDGREEDDDEQPFHNPLNLPLGWDGKPIPYWLYKLHGLGVEFKCEICGNHSYWGRRAFDRHFQEWRHAFGMRCLKIPNTKHFHDITLMRDAIQRKYTASIAGRPWRIGLTYVWWWWNGQCTRSSRTRSTPRAGTRPRRRSSRTRRATCSPARRTRTSRARDCSSCQPSTLLHVGGHTNNKDSVAQIACHAGRCSLQRALVQRRASYKYESEFIWRSVLN